VPSPSRISLLELAPAKVNLTLRVLGRRADGYHAVESLAAFAATADRLRLAPGAELGLALRGPFAAECGADADNLVLRAARALAAVAPRPRLGHFTLTKNLPVAAGLGGGSADAAAALRLLARLNRISLPDPRLAKIARSLGADVPVCIASQARIMRGIGDRLGSPLALPRLAAVLVNPGDRLATRAVFEKFDRVGAMRRRAEQPWRIPHDAAGLIGHLAAHGNDLEPAAIALMPSISNVLAALRRSPGCELARMSGSGPTCFGIYRSARGAAAAARTLAQAHPAWWVRATALGHGAV
jgi:4-diphosphocytidyl-2-C-methyl-D-erythritol kinase